MEIFKTFSEFKAYSNERISLRFDGFGYINTRITRIGFKHLRGLKKQLEHYSESNGTLLDSNILYHQISKEVEFRQTCLNMKRVFDISIK